MKTNEPVAIITAIATVINVIVLIVFKQELKLEEQTAIVAVLTLIAGFVARSRVTPVA